MQPIGKKNTDKLLERTKTKPQETLKCYLTKSMVTFQLNSPSGLEMRKYMTTIPDIEVQTSVFKIFELNIIFKTYTSGYWEDLESFEQLEEVIEQRSSRKIR